MPITVTLPGVGQIMTEEEQQVFSDSVLQFLTDNNNILSDIMIIEVDYTLVIVQMQAVIPAPAPAPSSSSSLPSLNATFIVSADVYSPLSQEIPADFNYRDNVKYGFETNMTGFLDIILLPALEDHWNISSFSIDDDDNLRKIGIIIICIAVLALQVLLVLICIIYVRKRSNVKKVTTQQKSDFTDDNSILDVDWRKTGSSSMESQESSNFLNPLTDLALIHLTGTTTEMLGLSPSPSWPSSWLCSCTPDNNTEHIGKLATRRDGILRSQLENNNSSSNSRRHKSAFGAVVKSTNP